MKNVLDEVSKTDVDVLVGYGGHKGAAGCTVRQGYFAEFQEIISKVMGDRPKRDDAVYYDLEIDASSVPLMLEELQKFEPFGEGNPKVVFKINHFELKLNFGAYSKQLKNNTIIFYGNEMEAISFGNADEWNKEQSKVLNFIGTIDVKRWRDKVTTQIEVHDFCKDSVAENKTNPLRMALSKMLAESGIEIGG